MAAALGDVLYAVWWDPALLYNRQDDLLSAKLLGYRKDEAALPTTWGYNRQVAFDRMAIALRRTMTTGGPNLVVMELLRNI
eukprot:8740778-Heterocapsa_arctica.AAC.1